MCPILLGMAVIQKLKAGTIKLITFIDMSKIPVQIIMLQAGLCC